MAQNVYLALTGQKLGDIKGSVTQRGFENLILVTAARHGLVIPGIGILDSPRRFPNRQN